MSTPGTVVPVMLYWCMIKYHAGSGYRLFKLLVFKKQLKTRKLKKIKIK